ncbi:MAG: hypothetical protein AAB110_08250, partial [Candidatus Desantisbacteria bacterium]
ADCNITGDSSNIDGIATINIVTADWTTDNPPECYRTIDLAGNPIDADGNPANGYQPDMSHHFQILSVGTIAVNVKEGAGYTITGPTTIAGVGTQSYPGCPVGSYSINFNDTHCEYPTKRKQDDYLGVNQTITFTTEYEEKDSDKDGITDCDEEKNGTDPKKYDKTGWVIVNTNRPGDGTFIISGPMSGGGTGSASMKVVYGHYKVTYTGPACAKLPDMQEGDVNEANSNLYFFGAYGRKDANGDGVDDCAGAGEGEIAVTTTGKGSENASFTVSGNSQTWSGTGQAWSTIAPYGTYRVAFSPACASPSTAVGGINAGNRKITFSSDYGGCKDTETQGTIIVTTFVKEASFSVMSASGASYSGSGYFATFTNCPAGKYYASFSGGGACFNAPGPQGPSELAGGSAITFHGHYLIKDEIDNKTGKPPKDGRADCLDGYAPYPKPEMPDESESVATGGGTIEQSTALVSGTQILIFGNGMIKEMMNLAGKIGFEYEIYYTCNDEEIDVNRFPVLVIPSGGLIGLEKVTTLKTVLSNYVKNGGRLVSFSQSEGYEFAGLPGGQVSAYGWAEDQSCHSNAVIITEESAIFNGQTRANLDVAVDGYFTGYPSNAKVLLTRTKNNQPAMIEYSYGAGKVIASTLYSDYSNSMGFLTGEEKTLVLNLIKYALNPNIEQTQHLKADTPEPGLSYSVQSSSDVYVAGGTGAFTINIWNSSDDIKNVRIETDMTHE